MPIPIESFYKRNRLHRWFTVGAVLLTLAVCWMFQDARDRPWHRFQSQYIHNKDGLAFLKKLGEPARANKKPANSSAVAGQSKALLVRSIADFDRAASSIFVNTGDQGKESRRVHVRELILPDVRETLSGHTTATTERCTTCHVAVFDRDFARSNLLRLLGRSASILASQSIDHAPQSDLAPQSKLKNNDALPNIKRTSHSSGNRRSGLPGLPIKRTDAIDRLMIRAGLEPLQLESPWLAHPNLDLYVMPSSPHSASKMGCTICHEGNPAETDFVLAGHLPPFPDMVGRWKDRYYVRRMGVPTATFERAVHSWDRPVLETRYAEAGCAQCHARIDDIGSGAAGPGSRIIQGRRLFASMGCVNCHPEDSMPDAPRVGPDLTRIASKLSPTFVQAWILNPSTTRPSARMPHLFDQENNSAASATPLDPEPKRRTQTEVAAITAYLFALSESWTPKPMPDAIVGDPSRGRSLLSTVGCLACHADLTRYARPWIITDLVSVAGVDRKTARRRAESMTIKDRMRYVWARLPNEAYPHADQRTSSLNDDDDHGDRDRSGDDIRPYRPPVATRFAPELSGIGSRTSVEWLYSWLMEPTRFAPDTKMPSLRLTPQEAADIASYLATLTLDEDHARETSVDPMLQEDSAALLAVLLKKQQTPGQVRALLGDRSSLLTKKITAVLSSSLSQRRAEKLVRKMDLSEKRQILLGHKLIGHYGCYGCHKIRGFEHTPPPGVDLSRWADKPTSRLDFGRFAARFHSLPDSTGGAGEPLHENDATSPGTDARSNPTLETIMPTRASFARHKLLNPRIWDRGRSKPPYEKLKMPAFHLSERQVDALVTFLLSRRTSRATHRLHIDYRNGTAGALADGRALVRELNCVGCHAIEGNTPVLKQYYAAPQATDADFDQMFMPPSLGHIGAKVRASWLEQFLGRVERIRPGITVRMPSFNLTEKQRQCLSGYFLALCRSESVRITEMVRPVEKLIRKTRRLSSDIDLEPTASDLRVKGTVVLNQAIGLDVAHGKHAVDPTVPLSIVAKLRQYVLEHNLLDENAHATRHAMNETPPRSLQRLLEVANRFANLLNVPTMETDAQDYPVNAARVAEGEKVFLELNCLGCHILGNERTTASHITRIGPSLGPVFRRLRPVWTHYWLENPRCWLPGTLMPSLFDQKHPRPISADSTITPTPMISASTDRGSISDRPDRIDAVIGFLHDAGRRGRETPKPDQPER